MKNINVNRTNAFKIAYCLGLGYALGFKFRQAQDSAFKESEHKRDKNGQFTKTGESGSGETILNRYKYDLKVPRSEIERIQKKYPLREPTEAQRRAAENFSKQLDSFWSEQSPKAKNALSIMKLNHEGFSSFPNLPNAKGKMLGLDKSKKIGLALESYQRIRHKHPDLTDENLIKGLGAVLYGNVQLKNLRDAKSSNYLHFEAHLQDRIFSDVVLDIEKVNDHYEIVHFFKKIKKKP